MTAPALETLTSEKDKLYVTDVELIRRLGVPDLFSLVTADASNFNAQIGKPNLGAHAKRNRIAS